METTNSGISEIISNAEFTYCLVVAGFGVLAIILIFCLGKKLYDNRIREVVACNRFEMWIDRLLNYYEGVGFKSNVIQHLSNANSDILQRRNEFWATYLQVVVVVMLVVVIAILLITRTISAEAGLPILSAVTGFAVAKSVATTKADSASSGDSSGLGKPPKRTKIG